MFKKRTGIFACIACLIMTESYAQAPRERVASPAERIARARWQPIRQDVSEAIDEKLVEQLPAPAVPKPDMATNGSIPQGSPSDEFMVEESPYLDERYREGDYYGEEMPGSFSNSGCGNGQCDSYGRYSGRGNSAWRPMFCFSLPSDGWVSAEYLMWWQKGMQLPPLVTTSNAADAGVLGKDTTRTLFGGDDDYLTDSHNGMRFRLGFWLDACHRWGIEAEHFSLDRLRDSYSASGDGSPILARPFFNMETNADDAELVSYPNLINGSVSAEVTSKLNGTGVHVIRRLCCGRGCALLPMPCASPTYSSRLEGLLGWRRIRLKETLDIHESLSADDGAGSFDIRDHFGTHTTFNGLNVGLRYHRQRGRLSCGLSGKLGLGSNRQAVAISGRTRTVTTTTDTYNTGILTAASNIGSYDRDRFAIVPEIGITAGYNWTSNLRFMFSYNFMYWSNVVRPGDQVDLDLNPSMFAPSVDNIVVSSRPRFDFNQTDFWVQGWSIGAEYRF